jgi:hypothetical protein
LEYIAIGEWKKLGEINFSATSSLPHRRQRRQENKAAKEPRSSGKT